MTVMKLNGVLIALSLKIIYVESRMLPLNYLSMTELEAEGPTKPSYEEEEKLYEYPYHKVLGLKEGLEHDHDELEFQLENKPIDGKMKPCSVVVLSNAYNPAMQSLLRKYRYDANGILIPSSVKYYMKFPQGIGATPLLIPLNNKAFSPLGGFVRYYKEVPPIPQSW